MDIKHDHEDIIDLRNGQKIIKEEKKELHGIDTQQKIIK